MMHVADFNIRNKILSAKLFKQGYRYHKCRKDFIFLNYIDTITTWYPDLMLA